MTVQLPGAVDRAAEYCRGQRPIGRPETLQIIGRVLVSGVRIDEAERHDIGRLRVLQISQIANGIGARDLVDARDRAAAGIGRIAGGIDGVAIEVVQRYRSAGDARLPRYRY